MNSKIISQQKNPFLQREEITIEIQNEVTPKTEEVKTAIGEDANLTIIKKINTNFGKQTFTAEALIYDNNEAKNKIETIPQKIRKKIQADKKTAKEAEAKATAEPEPKPEEPKPESPTETVNSEPSTVNTQSTETKPTETVNSEQSTVNE